MDNATDLQPQEEAAVPAASEVNSDTTSLGTHVKTLLRKLGLAVLFLVITVSYVGLGGMVFSALESPNEFSVCNTSRELHLSNENATLELVLDIVSRLDGIATYTPAKLASLEASFQSLLDRYGEAVVGNGFDPSRDCDLLGTEVYPLKWSFMPAALFSMTIISTIGYGNIAPLTPWGRFVCIPYAILGISIYFFFLATFGPLVSGAFKGIYSIFCCCGCVRPRRRKKPVKRKPILLETDQASRSAEPTIAVGSSRGLIAVRAAAESLDPEAAASTVREATESNAEVPRHPSAPHRQQNASASIDADVRVRPSPEAASSPGAGVDSPTLNASKAAEPMSAGRSRSLSKFDVGSNNNGRGDKRRPQTPSSASLLVGALNAISNPDLPATATEYDSRQEKNREAGEAVDELVISQENRDKVDDQIVQYRKKMKDAAKTPQEVDQEEEEKAKAEEELEPSLPLVLCIGIFAGILVLSGAFFRQFETWDETESIYFSFVTLATIGLGDLVPGTRADLTATEVAIGSLSGMLFILIGMAFVSVLFDLMARAAAANFAWLAKKCRRPPDSRGDTTGASPRH